MYTVPLVCEATFESTVHDADQEHTDYSSSPAAKVVRDFYKAKDLSATVWTSTTGLGRPDQILERGHIEVDSADFGTDRSRRVLEARPKSLVRTVRLLEVGSKI